MSVLKYFDIKYYIQIEINISSYTIKDIPSQLTKGYMVLG